MNPRTVDRTNHIDSLSNNLGEFTDIDSNKYDQTSDSMRQFYKNILKGAGDSEYLQFDENDVRDIIEYDSDDDQTTTSFNDSDDEESRDIAREQVKNVKSKSNDDTEIETDGEDGDDELEILDHTMESMRKNYSYPDPTNQSIQYELYKKREFYYNRVPKRPEIDQNTDYATIKEYRDNICARAFTLHEHQGMLSNFINPDTPYKGIMVFHGLGSGKCVHPSTLVQINGVQQSIESIWDHNVTDIWTDNQQGIWSKPKNELIVNSLDGSLIVRKRVKHLYREMIDSHIREITLDNGQVIRITDVHKLFTPNGWTSDLSVGQMVGVSSVEGWDDVKLVYQKIFSIKHMVHNGWVYDLEIEETHNYIANGFICHNTCVGIAIAEKFKEMVLKYNTKIYILVPGPIIKESWKYHLLFCTGETYKKYQDKYTYLDEAEKSRLNKQALAQALQYYKIMSYRSFYKRVLGEKIKMTDKKQSGSKNKTTYRKTDSGDFERDIAIDRIYNLNNSVIIVDEAHNLTGNAYGKALQKVIKNSINLKTVLMSATPMKNLGSDIIELINFLRPADSLIERDMIFNSYKNHMMDFKKGGIEYFKNMINGYISHVRGSDPLTFARREDRGTTPEGLLFTKMTRCEMLPFQRKTYDGTIKEFDDALDRKSEAVANFSFPGLSKDRQHIVGYYGKEGLNTLREQIKSSSDILNRKIGEMFFGGKESTDLVYLSGDGKTITGKIFKSPYLKNFSIKFYKALKKVNRLVAGKKGAQTCFVYSNLVKVGIEIFQEILLQNGYLEFQEDSSNYTITGSTVCYYCGKPYREHTKMNRAYNDLTQMTVNELKDHEPERYQLIGAGKKNDEDEDEDTDSIDSDDSTEEVTVKKSRKIESSEEEYLSPLEISRLSESSTEYDETKKIKRGVVAVHKFYPATFVSITGKSSEEKAEMIPEEKKRILDNHFNNLDNKEGKMVKLILGSRVMNEGISMKNVGEVHILDVYFNLGKVDQVVGRAIRWCSHYKMAGENNMFPYVNVYKYVVSLAKDGSEGLSSEEELYQKAEKKYLLIKRLERAMKERAFDCPLNINGNVFHEEVVKYKDCDVHKNMSCPAICDYQKCHYKCDDPKLNMEYYDPNRAIYRLIEKKELDYSTFTHSLAQSEINYAKEKIKEMYIIKPVYTLEQITEYVKSTYDSEKRDLFDEFFVFKALDSLIPITENDFNNFKDTIIDRNNVQGYIIYRDTYYIFQPFNQNEDVPLIYRINNMNQIHNELSLYNYLRNSDKYKKIKDTMKKHTKKDKTALEDVQAYNFENTLEYYDDREEFDFVGIVDKEISRRKNKRADEIRDVFKIREKLPKILDKKRGTGIPSLKGAVCSTSKSKEYLEEIAHKIGLKFDDGLTRGDICQLIEKEMLLKEKYSTDSAKNKFTYVRLPSNHPLYPFPYNLEDRMRTLIQSIRSSVKHTLDIKTTTINKKTEPEKGKPSYQITITRNPKLEEYDSLMKKFGAVQDKTSWTIMVE